MPSPNEILTELKKVKYPGFTRDIVSFGIIKDIEVGYSGVTVSLTIQSAKPEVVSRIVEDIKTTVAAMPGVPGVKVDVEQPAPTQPRTAAAARRSIEGVKHIVAVASGKGGRRQIHRRGKPRARNEGARMAHRPDGRRRVRPQRRDDGGRRGQGEPYTPSGKSYRLKDTVSATSRWRFSSATSRL